MPARSCEWLIYALGGGWGHLTRAAALARAASRRHAVRILTNSPYAEHVRAAMPQLDLVTLDPALPVEAASKEAVRQVRSADPEVLIVDTFPRGLGGELVDVLESLPSSKVLVHRDISPEYVAAYHLREFVDSNYDLVLVPCELEAPLGGIVTAPWLIRSRGELPSRKRALRLLGIDPSLDPSVRVVLVCASGNTSELRWYGRVTARLARDPALAVRCVAAERPPDCPAECWLSYWPAVDLTPAVDVVVGGGGYNTVQECIWYGVALVARAWPRKYDRQLTRLKIANDFGLVRIVRTVEDAERAVRQAIPYGRRPAPAPPGNGATEAVRLIERHS